MGHLLSILSVVIATHNAAPTIERCLNSFLACNTTNIEIIIKDCASTDGTQTIVKSYAPKLPIHLISLSGAGIYDVWNQVLAENGAVQGSWVLFGGV